MEIPVELRPVADLVPHERNAWKHSSAAATPKLAKIIEKLGWTIPILVAAGATVARQKRRHAARDGAGCGRRADGVS